MQEEQSCLTTSVKPVPSFLIQPMRRFSPQEGVNDLGATHFIGIGGAGMSVLAEMLHEQGVEVDGSDREPSAKTDRLQGIGITVEFGQRAENVEGKHTVVFSSAIKSDNPETSQHTKQANASCTAATFSHC